jgi:hypothetical protein
MQGGTKHGPSFGNALPEGLIQHKASLYIYINIFSGFIFLNEKFPCFVEKVYAL